MSLCTRCERLLVDPKNARRTERNERRTRRCNSDTRTTRLRRPPVFSSIRAERDKASPGGPSRFHEEALHSTYLLGLCFKRNSAKNTDLALLRGGARGFVLLPTPLSATHTGATFRSDHPVHGKQADVLHSPRPQAYGRPECKDQCLRRIASRARRCPTSCRRQTLSQNRHSLRHRPTRSNHRRSLDCPVPRPSRAMTDIREGLVYLQMMEEMARREGSRRDEKAP